MGWWRLAVGGCWEGWGYCLREQRVLSEVAAAVVGLVPVIVAAAVQVDVVAPHC